MQCDEGSVGEAMQCDNLWGRMGRRWKCVEKSTVIENEERRGTFWSGGFWTSLRMMTLRR